MSTFNKAFKQFLSLMIVILLLVCNPVLAKKGKEKKEPKSHCFFAYEDADYHTSPDKRIGAKLLIDPVKVGPSIAALTHLTFLPGAHIKSKRHVFVATTVYVLEGNLTLRIGKETKVLGANSTAYIPPKTFHEYLNDSGDVVKFLQYFAPSGPEEEYRNWERPSQTKPRVVEEKKVEEKESTNIVTPPLPPVAGSPIPRLGGIKGLEEEKQSKEEIKDINFKLRND